MSGRAPALTSPPTATSPRWNRRRSCGRSAPRAQRRAWPDLPRTCRSRTSPSTPRWLLPPSITGPTRSPGCGEMRRVARRVVVLTHDASDPDRFWLNRDYLPEHNDLWAGRPSLTELARAIAARTEPVPIPWDCADGFYEAYWRRPEAYLDEHVRRGMSIWARG